MITNAFTCTGAYAVLILSGIKEVENRSVMPVPAKGRCAISCSKSFCKEEFGRLVSWAAEALDAESFARLPSWDEARTWPGKVVGTCAYAAYEGQTRGSASLPWDEGCPCWWKLSEVVRLARPIACRGNVGMWRMPDALAAAVSDADVLARAVGTKISMPEEAAQIFRAAVPLAGANEGLFVLPMDDDRHVLVEPMLVSLGSEATTEVRPGDVFSAALKVGASTLILAHNHPSGNPKPSAQDVQLTQALVRLGEELNVKVLDHLVLGSKESNAISLINKS